MDGPLGNLMYVCSEIWKQIGVAQRLSLLLVALLGLSALGAVLYFGSQPNWHVVYSELPAKQAAAVYELAQDQNIPVKLTAGGHTVKVPFKYASDLRASVSRSSVDVERRGTGLELFDNLKLGMTEMQQRVGLQRAVQGELERMITAMDPVKSARVMLALPERRVFRREAEEKPEASVFLQMQGRQVLDQSQVRSICRMVAGAVPELSANDVTITDSEGTMLARGGTEDGGTADGNRHLELQQNMASYLQRKAEAALRPIVGSNSVVAVADVNLDTNETETTTETYDAAQAVIIHERMISEDNAQTDHKRTRAAGTASNLVSVENPEENGTPTDESKESRKTVENQYAVPKTTRHVKARTPTIKHLSVAVTIAQKEEGKPRPPELLGQYRSLVMSSVGAVENGPNGRSDTVTVVEGPFSSAPATVPAPASPADRVLDLATRISPMQAGRSVLAVLLLFVLYRMFRGMLRRTQMESMDLGGGEQLDENVYTVPGSGMATEQNSDGQHTEGTPAERIRARMDENPAEVAASLESWMKASRKQA